MIRCKACDEYEYRDDSNEAYCMENDGEEIRLYRGQCRPRWCPKQPSKMTEKKRKAIIEAER